MLVCYSKQATFSNRQNSPKLAADCTASIHRGSQLPQEAQVTQGGSQRNKAPAFPCADDWIKAYRIDLIFNYFSTSMAEGVPGSIGATCCWASPPIFPEIAVGTTKGLACGCSSPFLFITTRLR